MSATKSFPPGARGRCRPSRYAARLATTPAEVDAALRLRFEVFNRELGEGLAASCGTGRDEDEFDSVCDHLVVVESASAAVVGTYRLQTGRMAAASPIGFYSAREFVFERLPSSVLAESVELGRACIARAHRNTRVLLELWRGIANYSATRGARSLFGCCSLPGTDPTAALDALRGFREAGLMHDRHFVPANPAFACPSGDVGRAGNEVRLSPLFEMYLRQGARVCSEPALDREFGTTDFLVLLEIETLAPSVFDMFFG